MTITNKKQQSNYWSRDLNLPNSTKILQAPLSIHYNLLKSFKILQNPLKSCKTVINPLASPQIHYKSPQIHYKFTQTYLFETNILVFKYLPFRYQKNCFLLLFVPTFCGGNLKIFNLLKGLSRLFNVTLLLKSYMLKSIGSLETFL